MKQKIRNFKDLKIWQKGVELATMIYKLTNSFPAQEAYGMVNQMRRAAVSIPSNIAEGFMRQHDKEHRQFLRVTLGSLAEIETQLIISKELGFITQSRCNDITQRTDELNKMVMGLIKCL